MSWAEIMANSENRGVLSSWGVLLAEMNLWLRKEAWNIRMLELERNWRKAWWLHIDAESELWIPIPAVTLTSLENLASYLNPMNLSFPFCKTGTPTNLVFHSWFLVAINWSALWPIETEKEFFASILGSIGKMICFSVLPTNQQYEKQTKGCYWIKKTDLTDI